MIFLLIMFLSLGYYNVKQFLNILASGLLCGNLILGSGGFDVLIGGIGGDMRRRFIVQNYVYLMTPFCAVSVRDTSLA